MKKALKLALIYLILLIVGIIPGTFLYALYLNVLDFVTGHEVVFFADSDIFNALFFVTYCMLFFICPLISYYRIRHPGGVLQFIVYVVLCLLTWIVLFPCILKLHDFCAERFSFEKESQYLSSNYFRKVDNRIYYFTKDFESKGSEVPETTAIIIDTSENGGVDSRLVRDYSTQDYNRKAAPFREIQLKKIFDKEKSAIPVNFHILIEMVSRAFSDGLPFFLTFLSFVLVLCSLYAVTSFFDWRLISSVMLFILAASIMCVNSMYYTSVFNAIKGRVANIGFFQSFGKIVSEPLLFLVNCIIALVFVILGIIKIAVRKHAGKEK